MLDIYIFVIISVLLSKFLPNYVKKFKLDNSLDSHNDLTKNTKNNTPILGGLIFIIPISLYLIFTKQIKLLFFLLPSILFGFYDDFSKLKGSKTSKGLNKLTKTIFLIANYLFFTFLFNSSINLRNFIFYLLFYTGVLVTDGIDGLLTSLSIITLLFLTISFGFNKLIIVSILSLIVFLFVNLNPSKIFMGDTGSSFLAALLYFLINNNSNRYVLGSIFILGSVTSILQILSKKILKKKILNFSPFHHNLETLNWKENEIVTFYVIVYILILINFSI